MLVHPSSRIKVDRFITSFRSLLPSEGNGELPVENGVWSSQLVINLLLIVYFLDRAAIEEWYPT